MSIVGMLIALLLRRSQQPFHFSQSPNRHLHLVLQSWDNSGQLRSWVANQLQKLPFSSVSPQIFILLLSGWPWDGKRRKKGKENEKKKALRKLLFVKSASYIYIYLFICNNNELLFHVQGPKTRSLQKQADFGLFLFLSSLFNTPPPPPPLLSVFMLTYIPLICF